ncbi:hypothetical protein ACIA8C_18375 [Nocardia sp. NPDC051321]|uniref:hypothetical protein n=1 Tax=Nocardia sp. NPDC051321 TaxID=3364323 RepID=UPI0037B042E3
MTQALPAAVTGVFGPLAPRDYDRPRTIHLRFVERTGDRRYLVEAWGSAFPEDGGGTYQGWLGRDALGVISLREFLRWEWEKHILQYEPGSEGTRFPFSDLCNLSHKPHLLERKAFELVHIGATTFRSLFDGNDEGLRQIRTLLENALRSGTQVITFESEKLCMPWGMLYTSPYADHPIPSESRWSYEGFLGYQHIIEHTFGRMTDFDPRILIPDTGLAVGINVDHRIDDEFPDTPYIGPTIAFFRDKSKVVVRTTKREVEEAFRNKDFTDNITYFGCHARVTGQNGLFMLSYVELDEDERIHGQEISDWLKEPGLATRPLIYIGACQGGLVDSTFYSSFGGAMLDKNGGRCLVGPQLNLPPVFAAEYSRQLFTEFLRPETKLGDLMQNLAQKFIDVHKNPLGLMFALYRGIDVHLWPEGNDQ